MIGLEIWGSHSPRISSLIGLGRENSRFLAPSFKSINVGGEKAEEPEIKVPTSVGSWKKREFQKIIYFCFIDYAKAFDCADHNELWKILKEMAVPDHLPAS